MLNGSDDASAQGRLRRRKERGRKILVGALVALLVLDAVLLVLSGRAAGMSARLAATPGLALVLHRGLAVAALVVAIVSVVLIMRDE